MKGQDVKTIILLLAAAAAALAASPVVECLS
jgi:hypothetical protein